MEPLEMRSHFQYDLGAGARIELADFQGMNLMSRLCSIPAIPLTGLEPATPRFLA